MILFDLCCKNKHTFEAWFPSTKKYEELKKKNMVKCPICNSHKVKKALMAPNIGVSKKGKEIQHAAYEDNKDKNLRKQIKKMKKLIEENTDNVGNNFAEEARKIYYGEKKARPIRGQTTSQEAKDLENEGVPFSTLPWPSREDA